MKVFKIHKTKARYIWGNCDSNLRDKFHLRNHILEIHGVAIHEQEWGGNTTNLDETKKT